MAGNERIAAIESLRATDCNGSIAPIRDAQKWTVTLGVNSNINGGVFAIGISGWQCVVTGGFFNRNGLLV